jgi:hypothetical protein
MTQAIATQHMAGQLAVPRSSAGIPRIKNCKNTLKRPKAPQPQLQRVAGLLAVTQARAHAAQLAVHLAGW